MTQYTLINGKLNNKIDISCHNLQCGDGIYEICLLKKQQLLLWDKHYQSLNLNCAKTNIKSIDKQVYLKDIQKLVNISKFKNAEIKIILSFTNHNQSLKRKKITRIVSIRKYKPKAYKQFSLSVNHSYCLTSSNLSVVKHCSQMEKMMAIGELKTDDAIVLNQKNQIISTLMSNIFIIKDGNLLTPDLNLCGVNGVVRQTILELSPLIDLDCQESQLHLEDILNADEVFITNTLLGIQSVSKFQNRQFKQTTYANKLKQALNQHINNQSIPIKPKLTLGKLIKIIGLLLVIALIIVINESDKKTLITPQNTNQATPSIKYATPTQKAIDE